MFTNLDLNGRIQAESLIEPETGSGVILAWM
jgi:hypothetical protein